MPLSLSLSCALYLLYWLRWGSSWAHSDAYNCSGETIVANEKNVPVNNKTGEVTHKLVITTTEGNFTVSLFSNNEVHQDFAKAFCGDADISDLFSALTTNVVIVKNEQAPKDESRIARLEALKAGVVQP